MQSFALSSLRTNLKFINPARRNGEATENTVDGLIFVGYQFSWY